MCDCYGHKCKFCNNEISIHIADYCTARKNIDVICPDCQTEKAIDMRDYKKLWVAKIEFREQVFGKLKDGRYKGKTVLLLSKDGSAYGVCLN